MTQTINEAQPSTREELWAAYERLRKEEEDAWREYMRLSAAERRAYARSRRAHEAYRAASERAVEVSMRWMEALDHSILE